MAGKRGNGEGSIFRRSNGKGWQGQITIGRDSNTGKLKRLTFYGKTQKEVQQKMAAAQSDITKGTFVEPHKTTISQWFTSWLETYKKPPNVKLSTYVSYEMLIRQHVIPKLGDTLIINLKPELLQKFYNEKFTNGRIDGSGGLSSKTLRNLHNMIHECLQQAVYNGLVNKNVSEGTVLPKKSSKKDLKILTVDEQKQFLQLVKEERLRAIYYLLLGSGVRLGEALALTWNMLDLDSGIIKIRQTLNRLKTLDPDSPTKTKLIFQEPKSASGNRNIPISPSIISELKLHKDRQEIEKSIANGIYNDMNLVFCSSVGTPIDPRSLIRNLHNICKKNGIRRLTIHTMRHTYASRLLETNQHPKLVQELLGHSNIGITLDTYSHVLPELKIDAVNTLDNLFTPEKNQTE